MKNVFNCLLLGLLLLSAVHLNAQQFYIDSLETVLQKKDISTHQRIMTMSRLADIMAYQNAEKGLKANQKAIGLAQRNKDVDGLVFTWTQQVALAARARKTALAQKALDSSLIYAHKTNTPLLKGLAWYRKGYLENIQNNLDEALKSWHKALKYLDDSPQGNLYKSATYYLLFGVYSERNDAEKATHYAQLSLKHALSSQDLDIIINSWQINGTNNLERFYAKKDTVFLDSAVIAFEQSVHIFKQKRKFIKNESSVALSALNLANIYMDYYPPRYRDSIIDNINLALEVSFKVDNVLMSANAYNMVSKLNMREGNYEASEKALLKEKTLVDSLTPPNYFLALNLYQSLAKIKEKQEDSKQALAYYKQYLNLYKKEFDQEQNNLIQKLDAKYQSEKKDKKLQLLKQRNEFQKKRTYWYIGIAAVAVVSLLLLFIAYHFKLKYSLQREKLKEEEAARLKAEQNLMQSEKEQLQKELMAGTLHIKHKNELLENLKAKLEEQPSDSSTRQLERMLNEEMRTDKDFDHIRTELKNLHPEFFKRLQEKSKQDLTQLDLKYCAYISLKLSTKQIAGLMNITPKSVRMARYRLKQKLGLNKEQDLDGFILDLFL